MDQPAFKMGKISAQTFFEMLKNPETNIAREIILKPKLIVREAKKWLQHQHLQNSDILIKGSRSIQMKKVLIVD